MANDIPIEIVMCKPPIDGELIDASFQQFFKIGTQDYVAIQKECTVFILKVLNKDGQRILMNIQSEVEFDSAKEVYQKTLQSNL
ncbi:DUF1292 domain-containing protein [Paenibacillus aestuarii]|uniref:DUF1292 domain-containing protein n=1 Tax=Paenibacillus aestuarii TaxID=516965 RepID=A0ABW0K6U0_9BACL